MSTVTATARVARPPRDEREETRHLEIAPTAAQRRARPKLIYAVIVVGGIGVILLAQLLLSIATADGAFRIHGLQAKQLDYSRAESAAQERLTVLRSTQNLTRDAEALGMVASGNPVFLNAANGQVSGAPSDAGGALTGAGNLIPNSLLAGSAIDPAAMSAENQAADQAAQGAVATTEEGGGIVSPGDAATTAASGTGASGTGAGAPAPTAAAPSVPSTPGVLASPTTR